MNAPKKILTAACRSVMVTFVLWLCLMFFLMLIAGGTPLSDPADYLYFIALLVLAILATAWAFTSRTGKSAYLGVSAFLGAIAYWWFGICRMRTPIWSDFKWFVIPTAIFAIAALTHWRSALPDTQPQSNR